MRLSKLLLLRRTSWHVAAVVVGLCAAASAKADVLEIKSDGSVVVVNAVRDGHAQQSFTSELGGARGSPLTPNTKIVPTGALAQAFDEAARRADISPYLLEALVWQESRWNPAALSKAGAIGLAQLMPGTAREFGVNPHDPAQNLAGGARYLRQQLDRFGGNLELALAAYNAGAGRVRRAGGVPRITETQIYVRAIMARLASNIISAGGDR
jgi:soluble lytic murein transglycosylase-like protein